MKLVPDWKRTWRYYSQQAMVAAVAIQGAWMGLPEDLRSSVPENVVPVITGAVLVLGIIGRLVDQPEK